MAPAVAHLTLRDKSSSTRSEAGAVVSRPSGASEMIDELPVYEDEVIDISSE